MGEMFYPYFAPPRFKIVQMKNQLTTACNVQQSDHMFPTKTENIILILSAPLSL